MQLNEFGTVLRFIEKSLQDNDLETKYSGLIEVIKERSQVSSSDVSEKFQQQLNDLTSLLNSLQPNTWGYSKQLIFDQLNAGNYIGTGAAQKLTTLLSETTADTNSAISKIQELSSELKVYRDRISQIIKGMGDLITIGEEPVPEGMGILQLVFTDEVEIKTIEDLEYASEEWKFIIKGLSLVVQDKQDSPHIRSISKNSPLWVEISGYTATLLLIGNLVEKILDIYIKILELNEIRNRAVSTNAMPSMVTAAEEDIKEYKKRELTRVREESLKLAVSNSNNNLNGETKNWYEKAVEKIYNFIVYGGRVDVATTATNNMEIEGEIGASIPGFQFKVAGKFIKVRELETRIGPDRKLIESTVTERDKLEELLSAQKEVGHIDKNEGGELKVVKKNTNKPK